MSISIDNEPHNDAPSVSVSSPSDHRAPAYGKRDVCESSDGKAREESDRHGPLSMTSSYGGVASGVGPRSRSDKSP